MNPETAQAFITMTRHLGSETGVDGLIEFAKSAPLTSEEVAAVIGLAVMTNVFGQRGVIAQPASITAIEDQIVHILSVTPPTTTDK